MINEKRLGEIIKEEIDKEIKNTTKSYTDSEIEILFHLSQKTKEELQRIYIDYSKFDGICGFGNILRENNNNSYLVESAVEPLPYEQVLFNLSQRFLLQEWQVTRRIACNNIEFIMIIPDVNKNVEIITKSMKQMGYFKGNRQDRPLNINGLLFRVMQFEPLVQKSENDLIRSMNVVYHLSPKYNLTSILNQGIIPQSDNELFNYPDRVFLAKGDIPTNEIPLVAKMLSDANNNPQNDGSYIVFVIDLNKVPQDVDFYLDGNFQHGCFTEQNIPKDAIVQYFDIKVEKKKSTA